MVERAARARTVRRVLLGTGRTAVALLAVAVVVGSGYAWTAYRNLQAELTTTEVLASRPPTAEPLTPRRTYTALLVGLDSRTDAAGDPLPRELLDQIHAGDDQGELNTDTIMLVRVPADPGAPVVTVSFPRDSYVPIADGSGRHKINSAYRRGYQEAARGLRAQGVSGSDLDRRSREAGRATLVATVEQVSGVTIDHFAEINLAGFVELTDTLGGVAVCLNAAVDDRAYSGVDLPAGPQTISGAGALAFVRQRHGLGGGDLDRITRQQAFLAGLANQVLTAGTLADPGTVSGLMTVVTRHVVVDSGWNLDQLVTQLGQLAGADVVFRTIPTVRPDLRTPYDGVAVEIEDTTVRQFVHTVLFSDARAGTTPTADPSPDPTAASDAVVPLEPAGATRVRASSPSPTTGPARPDPWGDRPVIDASGVPCVD